MAAAVLVFLAGPLKGTTRTLEPGSLTIGRDDTATLAIADPALSRQHCVITCTSDGVTITDLRSLNGTFVNDVPVAERTLDDGDRLRIGDSLCIVVRQADDSSPPPVPRDDEIVLRPETTMWVRREEARYLQPARPEPVDSRSARDLRTLLAISSAIHTTRQRDVLQRRLLELTMTAIFADCAALLLADQADDPLVPVAREDRGTPLPVSQTVTRRVLRDGVAVLSNDVGVAGAFETAASAIDGGIRSVLCAPLTVFDRPIGVIYLANRGTRDFEPDDLQLLIGVAGMSAIALDNVAGMEGLERETVRLRTDLAVAHNMLGESVEMRNVYEMIRRLAGTLSTVLIRGESGTGKELAARAIHSNSPRAERPFVAINCAALTDTLLESELFGHEKGSFTGAIAQKRGKLELADGGTLFLDEIGELTPSLQVKLLRVLQEREFERVGGTRPIKIDIRLVAATHRDLEASIKSGAFRADLYYRLNVVSLTMPALRDRSADIPLLANYFIRRYSTLCNRRVHGMSEEARSALVRYSWPGNVRELENAIERAVVMGSSDRVRQEDLPESVLEAHRSGADPLTHYHGALNDTKRRLIITAVERAAGNYTEAAKLLGVHPNYLHRLVRNLAIKDQLTKRGD